MIKPMLKGAEWKLSALREKRKPLLKAYDAYKASVAYGDREETEETHSAMLEWHNALLELNEEAIANPPEEVKYYIGE